MKVEFIGLLLSILDMYSWYKLVIGNWSKTREKVVTCCCAWPKFGLFSMYVIEGLIA